MPIKVLVVDDHRSFAQALSLALGLESDLQARAVSTGEEAAEAIGLDRPDVVLMDVMMPGIDGVELTRRLKGSEPDLHVIVLSEYEDDLLKARALEAGAEGYLSKSRPLEAVFDAVRKSRTGDPLMEPEEVERLLRRSRRRRLEHSTERQRADRLSRREREILQLMADGLGTTEISVCLGISPHTLRTHVGNITTKLGVHTKMQALLVAIRNGQVSARG